VGGPCQVVSGSLAGWSNGWSLGVVDAISLDPAQ
jgi:hypothetical protein